MTTTSRAETAASAIVSLKLGYRMVREAIPSEREGVLAILDLLEENSISMIVGATQTANALTDLRESMEQAGVIATDEDAEQERTGGL